MRIWTLGKPNISIAGDAILLETTRNVFIGAVPEIFHKFFKIQFQMDISDGIFFSWDVMIILEF